MIYRQIDRESSGTPSQCIEILPCEINSVKYISRFFFKGLLTLFQETLYLQVAIWGFTTVPLKPLFNFINVISLFLQLKFDYLPLWFFCKIGLAAEAIKVVVSIQFLILIFKTNYSLSLILSSILRFINHLSPWQWLTVEIFTIFFIILH